MAVQTQILHRRDTAANWTSTNPTLGSAEIGVETDTNKFKIGNGSSSWTALSYQGGSATFQMWRKAASGGETSLSGSDDFSTTLAYTVGAEQVFINGVLLERGVDYTASTGTSITGLTALVASDVATVVSTSTLAIANAIPLSTVTAKGDYIVATGASTVTNLPVGADGTTLVANSSAATGMSWTTPVGSLANPVINGGLDIWQRGTSISYAASTSGYGPDRWTYNCGANQASTVLRVATGDTTNLPNIQYAMQLQRNSGQTGTSGMAITQNIETINSIPFVGKTVTASFYMRGGSTFVANGGVTYPIVLMSGTGTDQNLYSGITGQVNNGSLTITPTTTWTRYVVTATIPTNATQLIMYFAISPSATSGASDYVQITGCQYDLGTYTATTAPAFRRSGGTLQGELAACQRYYMRWTAPAANSLPLATGAYYSTTIMYPTVTFPVPMRVQPTGIGVSAASAITTFVGGSSAASTAIALNSSSTTSMDIAVTTGVKTVGQAGGVTLNIGGAWLEVTGTEL